MHTEFKLQYALYYGLLGAVVPYWSLFLFSRGFDAREVGILVSLFGGTRILFPSLWGALSDRITTSMGIIWQPIVQSVCTFLALITFLPMTISWDLQWMLLWVLLYGACWSGIAPLLEARCMTELSGNLSQYGGIRVWGSIGFLFMVLVSGSLFDVFPVSTGLPSVLTTGLVTLSCLAVFCGIQSVFHAKPSLDSKPSQERLLAPEATQVKGNRGTQKLGNEAVILRSWWQLLSNAKIWRFLCVVCLMSLSHGPFYTFFAVYLNDLGYSTTVIGLLWGVGVAAEIVIFRVFKVLPKIPATNTLLIIAIMGAIIRWFLMIFAPESVVVIVIAQVLHAVSFGVMHLGAMGMVYDFFHGSHRAKGQALYSSVGIASGAALGALWSGWSWSLLGASATFGIAMILAVLALAVMSFSSLLNHQATLNMDETLG